MKQHNCIISSNVEEKKDYYLVQVLADLEGQGWAMPPRLADLGQWEPLIIYSVSEKNVPTLASCSFDTRGLSLIILANSISTILEMMCLFSFPYLFTFCYLISF